MSLGDAETKWSSESLAKGAALAADLAGLELTVDPSLLTREALIQAIQDPPCVHVCASLDYRHASLLQGGQSCAEKRITGQTGDPLSRLQT